MSTTPRPVVALVGSLDTKADEYRYLRDRLALSGVDSVLVDVSVMSPPGLTADVTREDVAAAAGVPVADLAARGDRNEAVSTMARGAATLVADLVGAGRAGGVLVVGGSNAGYVMSRVAAALPIGVPKMLVSTMVAGDTRPYVGATDLTMMYPVVDIAGLNSVSRGVLARAADALAGMVAGPPPPAPEPGRDVVGCTMMGVTTTCVDAVHAALEAQGAEVHVFHTTGVGGRSLEAMIRSGVFSAVADVTTTELVDELVGGMCSAGPDRLTAAVQSGVPQVVSVGGLDMAKFGPVGTLPEHLRDRRLHQHNPTITLVRTTPEENAELGRLVAEKLAGAVAPVEVHVPALGFSEVSVAGAPFHDPEADRALVDSLRTHLDPSTPLVVHQSAVNDAAFSDELVRAMARVLVGSPTTAGPSRQEGTP